MKSVKSAVHENDCRKCHGQIVYTIRIKGEAHRDLCQQCHQGHPPKDLRIIPDCRSCHKDDREHFKLEDCMSCHVDPHAPLEIRMSHDLTLPCLSCHEKQMEQLQSYPSTHSILACTACHNYHGQIQPCGNCHLPHSDTMTEESCTVCHQAHMPLEVSYGKNILSEECGSCHTDVYAKMVSNTSKHRTVSCIACHADIHGAIPECEKCHGQPHIQQLHSRFPRCGECHGFAHDLEATELSTSIFVKAGNSL